MDGETQKTKSLLQSIRSSRSDINIVIKPLPESKLDIYGLSPLYEELHLVCCIHCGKNIKDTHFRKHLKLCISLMSVEEKKGFVQLVGTKAAESIFLHLEEEEEEEGKGKEEAFEEKTTEKSSSKEKFGDYLSPGGGQSSISMVPPKIHSQGGRSKNLQNLHPDSCSKQQQEPLSMQELERHVLGSKRRYSARSKQLRSWTHVLLYGPSMAELPVCGETSTTSQSKTLPSPSGPSQKKVKKGTSFSSSTPKSTKKLSQMKPVASIPKSPSTKSNPSSSTTPSTTTLSARHHLDMIRAQLTKATLKAQAQTKNKSKAKSIQDAKFKMKSQEKINSKSKKSSTQTKQKVMVKAARAVLNNNTKVSLAQMKNNSTTLGVPKTTTTTTSKTPKN